MVAVGALMAWLVLTGTLFVLMKDPSPKQQLLEALASRATTDEEVQELVQQLESQSPERQPAKSVKSQGKWRLLWSMQVGLLVLCTCHIIKPCLLVLQLACAKQPVLAISKGIVAST